MILSGDSGTRGNRQDNESDLIQKSSQLPQLTPISPSYPATIFALGLSMTQKCHK